MFLGLNIFENGINDTVDGRNPQQPPRTFFKKKNVHTGINYLPSAAGLLPSTVSMISVEI